MTTMKVKHFHLIEDMDISAWTLAVVQRVEALAGKLRSGLVAWSHRSQERRALALMSEHMLDDVGLTSYDVEREVAKFFWQK